MTRRSGTAAVAGGLAGLFAVAFVAAQLAPMRSWLAGDGGDRAAVAVDCDLRAGPCEHAVPAGRIVLEITPRSIPLMQPLQLRVTTPPSYAPDSVSLAVRGLNMAMDTGTVRLRESRPGEWRGETILPICSQRRMEWEATVRVDRSGERLALSFVFDTQRR